MIRRALRKKMLMRQKLNVWRRKVILLEDGENPWLFLFHGRFLSKVTYGLSERFAGTVVRQGLAILSGMTQVQQHQYFLILRQAQRFGGSFGVEEVDPAAIYRGIGGGQHQVGGHDGGILSTGTMLAAGVGEHAVLVKGHYQHCGRAIAAGSELVNFSQPLGGLDNINMLLLQVLGGGGQAASLQNAAQLLAVTGLPSYFFAGIAVF